MRLSACLLLLVLGFGRAHAEPSVRDDCRAALPAVTLEAGLAPGPRAALHASESTTGVAAERSSRVRTGARPDARDDAAGALSLTLPRVAAQSDRRARFVSLSVILHAPRSVWLTTRPPPVPQH